MKISAWAKMEGHEISLNFPLLKADYTFASVLFSRNQKKFIADLYGGPGIGCENTLSPEVERFKPDYTLFPIDYSLGYTYRYCLRNCPFCVVPKIENDKNHYSIWTFHDPKFRKICLLNNNTFMDPRWKETFEEIWDANLLVIDENGYDLRLVDEEKANALAKTKWVISSHPHFSWDRMKDEKEILNGLSVINNAGIKNCTIHILIGFDTTIEEDIYRCQKIHNMNHDPFPMIYEDNDLKPLQHKFRRMIYARYYKKDGNIEKAWKEYTRK